MDQTGAIAVKARGALVDQAGDIKSGGPCDPIVGSSWTDMRPLWPTKRRHLWQDMMPGALVARRGAFVAR